MWRCDRVLAYRPYLSRMTRQNWPVLLIFPVLALFGAALVWVSLAGLWGLVSGLGAGRMRVDFVPAGLRALGAGVLLMMAGGLPLAPIPDRRGSTGAGGMVARAVAVLALLLMVFGPALGISLMDQVLPGHGYRACPATGRSMVTLHWVKSAPCPTGAD